MIRNLKLVKHIYKIIYSLLKEKAEITQGEVTHLKLLMKYIKNQYEEDSKAKSQFLKDVENLYNALCDLEKKIQIYIEDLESVSNERIESIEKGNEHLLLMLLFDCMQERSFSISEKLEYINQSYENLIEPYTSLYIPMPIVSKRIKTSNLMLYFNQALNEKYTILKESFLVLKIVI